nr:PLP-dependent aspartate aminotransferase family protein [Veillonella denticariosi]
MKFNTKCVHGGGKPDSTGAISPPAIYMSSTFSHPGLGDTTGYQYTRESNPTRNRLEQLIAGLEEGTDALAFSSGGMAAVDAVFHLFSFGDHIILGGDDLYGGSIRMFTNIYEQNGIEFTYVGGTSDLDAVKAAFKPNTKAVYIETPTNPMMEITDIRALCAMAHERNALVIIDNTFLSPYFQKPLTLGADIVIHSGTKFIGGHHDVISGFTIVKDDEIAAKLRLIYKTVGACLSAMDSWLVIRGVKTLALRMEQHQKNAIAIAQWLKNEPKVTKVLFPGLPEHPGYEINKSQTTGFGGMLSFEVDSEETAKTVLEGIELIQFAESLGGTESLLTYPVTQTHPDLKPEDAERKGITRRLLRLSVGGIEDTDDLIADLAQAFKK